MASAKNSLGDVVDELLEVIRTGWTWPSPEVGFARYVFEYAGASLPVPDVHTIWPLEDRLDHAPALASTGYLLGGRGRMLRPEWQRAWATGFDRLLERDPFQPDRMSFAYRPLYTLGIAIGAARCPMVTEGGRDRLRGVFHRLMASTSSGDWADLIYGMGAHTLRVRWRDQLLVRLDDAAPEVLGLLRWLFDTGAVSMAKHAVDTSALAVELRQRLMAGTHLPSDVAQAAVVCYSLQSLPRETSGPASLNLASIGGSNISRLVDYSSLQPLQAGFPNTLLQVNYFSGDQLMGDNSIRIGGDNIGGAVGRQASVVARDISVFREGVNKSSHMDDDLKAVLTQAREAVEKAGLSDDDKADVAESLRKLAAELDKPDKNSGLVRRFVNRINEVAPTVSAIVSTAATISQMVHP